MLKTWLNHQAAVRASYAIADTWQFLTAGMTVCTKKNLAWRLYQTFTYLSPAWGRSNRNWLRNLEDQVGR